MNMPTPDDRPLIVTLLLDEAAQATLNVLRTAHFPAGRNHLAAHLTLFHKLPGAEIGRIAGDLAEVAGAFRPIAMRAAKPIAMRAAKPIAMRAAKPIALGRGVAITLDAPALHTVRAELRRRWDAWLTPQDRQRHRPHVTIQNKVTPGEAKALHAELTVSIAPFPVAGTGLGLWRYLGGPWEPVAAFPFAENPTYVDPEFPDEPIL